MNTQLSERSRAYVEKLEELLRTRLQPGYTQEVEAAICQELDILWGNLTKEELQETQRFLRIEPTAVR